MDTRPDELSAAISRALPTPGMVISWVVVTEILDADGDRALGTFTSEDLPEWTAEGMLRHAIPMLNGEETDAEEA